MRKSKILFIIFGVIPTVTALVLHPYFCKDGMNAICYVKCISPLILGAVASIVAYSEEDE